MYIVYYIIYINIDLSSQPNIYDEDSINQKSLSKILKQIDKYNTYMYLNYIVLESIHVRYALVTDAEYDKK